MIKKCVLKFLINIPEKLEDKILFCFLILSLSFFFLIRILSIFLFLQTQKSFCSTVVCPDMQKKTIDELPLSIKIIELIRPVGGTLSLFILEFVFLLLNVRRKGNKIITYIGIIMASLKIFVSIIETGSNIDASNFAATKNINILNYINAAFVFVESLILYATVLAAFYRYKVQMNDYLVKKYSSL